MAESKTKPKILLLATGGTISMVMESGRSVPARTAADLLTQTSMAEFIEVRLVDLVGKPGPNPPSEDLLSLAYCIEQEARSNLDGIVITHGTDTMEEAAFFIDEVAPATVPIVFTGAMRPGWASGYDGIRNLENAIRVATKVPAEYGTLVTMNDNIFEAWSVFKADTAALDAFAARRGAPLGRIFGDQLELAWRPVSRSRLGKIPQFLPAVVPILAIGVADDAVLLDQLPDHVLQGIVIAGMAAGSVPPVACKQVIKLAEKGLPVVLCSGAVSGRTAEDYYYPGAYNELTAAGVIIENRLTPRKTRIRLMISLGLQIPYVPFGREFAVPSPKVAGEG